jgi:hypothetical protein
MKPILAFVLIFCFSFSYSQLPDRQILKGKINVPADAEASNINVYNMNSEQGTTTNSYGEFLIKVKSKDHLFISSVQFQNFEVEITKEIMKERDIVINIRENINLLNEVTVSSNVLSGNLNVDVKKIGTTNTNLNINQNELINGYNADITIDSQIRTENVAIDNDYLDYPMDFVQIFRRYVKKKDRNKKGDLISDDVDVEVRKMYDNEFFKENFNIKEEQINEFIFYAFDHGYDNKLLKKGSEMDLIQFLLDKAEEFNTVKTKID